MAMKVLIEFYRIREQDDAHALIGRETREVIDLAAAIEVARLLARTLDMPQQPDAMTITDADGIELHADALDSARKEGQHHELP